jgi:small-conductance mechanosensitive channel
MTSLAEKKQALRPAIRNVLLVLLIGLPFLLYVALQSGWTVIAWALAGVLALSMAVLVWLG